MRMCERTLRAAQVKKGAQQSDAATRTGVCHMQVVFDRAGCRALRQDMYAFVGIDGEAWA